MSFTIPGPTRGKVAHLVATHGAELLPRAPFAFESVPADRALICVVDTYMYETATYCFNALEFMDLIDGADFRKHAWLLMDKVKAEELSHFPRRAQP